MLVSAHTELATTQILSLDNTIILAMDDKFLHVIFSNHAFFHKREYPVSRQFGYIKHALPEMNNLPTFVTGT